jgi:hypothetical protein
VGWGIARALGAFLHQQLLVVVFGEHLEGRIVVVRVVVSHGVIDGRPVLDVSFLKTRCGC